MPVKDMLIHLMRKYEKTHDIWHEKYEFCVGSKVQGVHQIPYNSGTGTCHWEGFVIKKGINFRNFGIRNGTNF